MTKARDLMLLLLCTVAAMGCSSGNQAADDGGRSEEPALTIAPSGIAAALAAAEPGAIIAVEPGVAPGGIYVEGVHGTEGQPIVLRAADPDDPPVLEGGGVGMHLAEVSWLTIDGLRILGASGNGLNIDDGGSFDTPAHHITLRNIVIDDIGPEGNRDGLKLSGVVDFLVEGCVLRRWGSDGSGIDMVGCHRGLIVDCRFEHDPASMGSGVQAKGGSSEVTIRRCAFTHAGSRAVNIGGSTGLEFFRPAPQGYEAKDITVEGCTFVGSMAPIAYVGADGATVRHNTLYHPGRWALRILQETTGDGFVPCRNGAFTDNIVVFRSSDWASGGVNIGAGTAPETFHFARNLWYCEDDPAASHPALPVAEVDGVYGLDPLLIDPAAGDFGLQSGSPGEGKGPAALPPDGSSPR